MAPGTEPDPEPAPESAGATEKTKPKFIYALKGQYQKACTDVAAGLKLIRESKAPVDPMLTHELDVRQATCKHARTIAGND